MRLTSRRRFLVHTGAPLIFPALRPGLTVAQPSPSGRTQLILLGTGGGPRPRKNSFSSSQVVLVNNTGYVVDCGIGVAIHIASAGVALEAVRNLSLIRSTPDRNSA